MLWVLKTLLNHPTFKIALLIHLISPKLLSEQGNRLRGVFPLTVPILYLVHSASFLFLCFLASSLGQSRLEAYTNWVVHGVQFIELASDTEGRALVIDTVWVLLIDTMWVLLIDTVWVLLIDTVWVLLIDTVWVLLIDTVWVLLIDTVRALLIDTVG